MNTFPKDKTDSKNQNPSVEIFGDRFHKDQSLYEYLIEFLLVFSSPKCKTGNSYTNKMQFHHNLDNDLRYYAETKIGLKRFIFYADSKKDTSIPLDETAYNNMIKVLKEHFDDDDDEVVSHYINCIQDMLKGYSVVVKKRSWCAQQILPLCPELIFCEAQPNQKKRKDIASADTIEIDSKFEFSQHNFLARGGEVYYLHLLQYLLNHQEETKQLECLLNLLLTEQSKGLSLLSRTIQDIWTQSLDVDDTDIDSLYHNYLLGYIPEKAYVGCEKFAVEEIINFLSSDIELIKKIELFAYGIMLQVLRMMQYGISSYSNKKRNIMVIDMTNNTSDVIKKLSNQSLKNIENSFNNEIANAAKNITSSSSLILKNIKKGQDESTLIFKARAKDIRLIIPYKGANERFSLSENIIRFLVTSIIKPHERMTLDTFLSELYDHYDMVIGPNEYRKSVGEENVTSLVNDYEYNKQCFEQFLKSTGFLKELSDTTSIVFNPYNSVKVGE